MEHKAVMPSEVKERRYIFPRKGVSVSAESEQEARTLAEQKLKEQESDTQS